MTPSSAIHTDSPAKSSTGQTIKRHLPTAARILLGLVFFVFGLEGFLHFMPQPKEPPPAGAMALGTALMNSGYLFQLLKGTEVVSGALLLVNRFVPLALVLLAPVIVNIFAFHAFLEPSGLGLALPLVLIEAYLAWSYRSAYRSVLVPRAKPDGR